MNKPLNKPPLQREPVKRRPRLGDLADPVPLVDVLLVHLGLLALGLLLKRDKNVLQGVKPQLISMSFNPISNVSCYVVYVFPQTCII